MQNDLISRLGLGVGFCNPDVFENKAYAEGWNSLIKIIKAAPAVDAAPVRHGYWKSRANFLECSECGREFTQYDWEGSVVAYYYCPNCGAKMHVEVE